MNELICSLRQNMVNDQYDEFLPKLVDELSIFIGQGDRGLLYLWGSNRAWFYERKRELDEQRNVCSGLCPKLLDGINTDYGV